MNGSISISMFRLVFFLCLIPSVLISQDKCDSLDIAYFSQYDSQEDIIMSLGDVEKLLEDVINCPNQAEKVSKNLNTYGFISFTVSSHYFKLGQIAKADNYCTAYLDAASKNDALSIEWSKEITNLQGTIEIRKNNQIRAQEMFFQAKRYAEEIKPLDSLFVARVENNLGTSFIAQGNISKAKIHFYKSLALHRSLLPQGHLNIGTNLAMLSDVKLFEKDYDVAISYLEEAIKSESLPLPNLIFFKLKLVQVLSLRGDHQEGDKLIAEVEQDLEKAGLSTHPVFSKLVSITKAGHYTEKREYQSAIKSFEEALTNPLLTDYDRISIHLNKGKAHFLLGDEESGIRHFDRGFGLNGISLKEPNIDSSKNIRVSLKAISTYGQSLYSIAERKDTEEAYQSVVAFSDKNISTFKRAYSTFLDLHTQSEVNLAFRDLLESNIKALIKLSEYQNDKKYLEDALVMSELARAQKMSEAAMTYSLRNEEDISILSDIQTNEAYQRHALGLIESAIENKNDELLANQREMLDSLQHGHSTLLENLKAEERELFDLKFNYSNLEISNLRKDYITDDQMFLEYFRGDDALYVFIITKENLEVIVVDEVGDVISDINSFLVGLRNGDTDFALGRKLSASLCLDRISSLGPRWSSLVILPDLELSFLPFEVLSEGAVLLQDRYDISYAPSLKMLMYLNHAESPTFYAGLYAPEYDAEIYESEFVDVLPLAYAKEEVEEISLLARSKVFSSQQTSESLLKKSALDFSVLHLAMHGIINFEQPALTHLLFPEDKSEDGKLYLSEIESLNHKADLVVLSGCNTGSGRVHRTDGVQSMARSFLLSGSESVLMSLWSVPDEATKYIMHHFYKNLVLGKTTSQSLKLAKDQYRNDPSIPSIQKTPYYWAGFIHYGHNSKFSFAPGWASYIQYIIVFGILVLLLLFLRRYIKL